MLDWTKKSLTKMGYRISNRSIVLTTLAACCLLGGCAPADRRSLDQRILEASQASNYRAVDRLLNQKSSIDKQDRFSYTILLLAIDQNDAQLVQHLLAKGANPNGCLDGREDCLSYAIDLKGSAEIKRALIQAGARVNARQEQNGWTPLHRAANNGSADDVRLLVGKGADPNVFSMRGDTPLHLAAFKVFRKDSLSIAEALLKAGADKNAKNKRGRKPLDLLHIESRKFSKDPHFAQWKPRWDVLERLLTE